MPTLLLVVLGILGVLVASAIWDVVQTKHAILRVYPVIGRLRYLLEKVGPELRQYIVTSDLAERPYHRAQRSWAYRAAKGIDAAVLLGSRLYPDMFPLTRQVQIATDNAKGPAARLAGVEPPKYEDNEAGFAELQARIAKTIAYLQTLKAEQIDGSEDRAADARRPAGVQGPGLPAALRPAEFLFSRHDGLRHPAPQRRRDRQEGFHGRLTRPPSRSLSRRGARGFMFRAAPGCRLPRHTPFETLQRRHA